MTGGRCRRWIGMLPALALGLAAIPAGAQGDSRALTQAYNRSGQDLFRALAAAPGNVVLSPTSIGTAMAMVLAGARGETEAQMREVLRHTLSGQAIDAANAHVLAALLGSGAPSCPDGFKLSGRLCEAPAPKGKDAPCPQGASRNAGLCVIDARASKAMLRIANALMLVNPSATIADSFRDTIRTKYNAEIFPGADLATVNTWVKDKTAGKIPTILDKLSPNDSHVLLNAIYFNAPWTHAFAKTATREREFHLTAGETVEVPTMVQSAAFAIEKGEGFQAIRLPYAQDGLSMIVLRPDEIDGLDKVIADLTEAKLDALMQALRAAQARPVILSLPKFKFEFSAALIPPFKALGMTKVIAISGDTVDCAGLRRIAQGADVLVQCCYMATAEIRTEHFRRVAQYTLAAGDSVGKIAAQAGVKTLVLTHHLPRKDESTLELLAEEVARDFSGRIVIGEDLTEIDVT